MEILVVTAQPVEGSARRVLPALDLLAQLRRTDVAVPPRLDNLDAPWIASPGGAAAGGQARASRASASATTGCGSERAGSTSV